MASDEVTDKQRELIARLGGDPGRPASEGEASFYIEELLRLAVDGQDDAEATGRQMMELQFWARDDLFTRSRAYIVQWLDDFYKEDAMRLDAWETFKSENPAFRHTKSTIAWKQIELGMGYKYLLGLSGVGSAKPAARPSTPVASVHSFHRLRFAGRRSWELFKLVSAVIVILSALLIAFAPEAKFIASREALTGASPNP